MSRSSFYDKTPVAAVQYSQPCAWSGWGDVLARLVTAFQKHGERCVLAVDCYAGVLDAEVLTALQAGIKPVLTIHTRDVFKPSSELLAATHRFLGDDPVFGRMTHLTMADYLDPVRLEAHRRRIQAAGGSVLVYGPGAALVWENATILVYADMARWEIQRRHRENLVGNLGLDNHTSPWTEKYRHGYFNDWRICDGHKRKLFDSIDFFLDTNTPDHPKLVTGDALRSGLRQLTARPFRVVPLFDPAPWGGQWMKKHFGLDESRVNYGWGFDCVPEENSLLLRFGSITTEIPALNVVHRHPREILGEAVHARFGAEFPIRFDILDTVGGGNLSFQVHPLTEYIHQHFGVPYTQDESYYILDAEPGAAVYLGLKEDALPRQFTDELRAAQRGGRAFDVDKFVNRWPAARHDHFLIPAGTCHCSGAGCLVLEISATPYIFTFKLWDWGRVGLDGRPRPVHLDHGLANIAWDRRTNWTRDQLINRVSMLDSRPEYCQEQTGLHEREFIETRRHWFSGTVAHHTGGGVNVLNLVEGDEAVVESPQGLFAPFTVHYAETFIIPAAIGHYTIRPVGSHRDARHATIKASVRTGIGTGEMAGAGLPEKMQGCASDR